MAKENELRYRDNSVMSLMFAASHSKQVFSRLTYERKHWLAQRLDLKLLGSNARQDRGLAVVGRPIMAFRKETTDEQEFP